MMTQQIMALPSLFNELPAIVSKRATIGPPAKRHLNGVSLVGR